MITVNNNCVCMRNIRNCVASNVQSSNISNGKNVVCRTAASVRRFLLNQTISLSNGNPNVCATMGIKDSLESTECNYGNNSNGTHREEYLIQTNS